MTTDAVPNAFGRVMRFWRGVFHLSQEELAAELGVSLKHVSYLETGRSHPSEALVQRLGQLLGLGRRDLQFLSIAANHFTMPPQPLHASLSGDDLKPLIATLKSLDPFPAYITDPYGDIHLVNRAWAAIWRAGLGDAIDRPDANSYRFFFMNGGWRETTTNADDVGSWLLMSIQQEVLLHDDPRAARLLEEFHTQPYVPRDWAKRAALALPSYYYPCINRRRRAGTEREYWVTTHSVGSYPLSLGARFWINIVYPTDMKPDLTMDEIDARRPHHGKLAY